MAGLELIIVCDVRHTETMYACNRPVVQSIDKFTSLLNWSLAKPHLQCSWPRPAILSQKMARANETLTLKQASLTRQANFSIHKEDSLIVEAIFLTSQSRW